MKKRVAIYLRVSKSKQDTENQLRELSAVAVRIGATSVSGQKADLASMTASGAKRSLRCGC